MEPLAGGNRTPEVVRIGATVRRTRGPRSAFVAELLAHLAASGFTGAPAYLGVDEEGRDSFAYVEGVITEEGHERARGAYAAAGRLLRQLHDATAGHPLAAGAECVRHGDPGPGARLDDLAYMGWTWCVHSDWGATVQDEARRLRELRDGYGLGATDELLAAILEAQRAMERNGEAREDPGIVAWAVASREHLDRHASTFRATLSR